MEMCGEEECEKIVASNRIIHIRELSTFDKLGNERPIKIGHYCAECVLRKWGPTK